MRNLLTGKKVSLVVSGLLFAQNNTISGNLISTQSGNVVINESNNQISNQEIEINKKIDNLLVLKMEFTIQ